MTQPTEPTPAPGLVADLPGFLPPPARPPIQDPPSPEGTLEEASPFPPEGPELPPGPSSTSPPTGSSPASSADPDLGRPKPPPAEPFDAEGFAELAGLAFGLAGLGLHNRLAPGDNDLWLPSAEETEEFAEPMGRILARRAPISGTQSKDVADGIKAGVALVGFGIGNLRRQAEQRAWLQQAAQNAGTNGSQGT